MLEAAPVLYLPLPLLLPRARLLSFALRRSLRVRPVFYGPSPTLLAAVPVISSLARVEDFTSPRAPALLL